MATQTTQIASMIGFNSLSIGDANTEDFNSITLATEEGIARDILGDELYNAFEADVDAGSGTPTQQKHIDLLNGVTWIDVESFSTDVTFNLEGLTDAYVYFVYYEWLNQVSFVNNFVGKAQNIGENSTQMDRQSLNIESQNRYNKGINLYENLIEFVKYYEDYEADATSIVESPSGTYTVTITDTTYLINGDLVTIEGNDYTVAGLVADTSFTFTATTGLTFTDLEVSWHPFNDALIAKKGKIYFNGMI